jgi:hypothetical protein
LLRRQVLEDAFQTPRDCLAEALVVVEIHALKVDPASGATPSSRRPTVHGGLWLFGAIVRRLGAAYKRGRKSFRGRVRAQA